MAPHTRRPSIPDAQSAKPSPGKSVLRWLKKAVGLGSPHKQTEPQRRRRNGQQKRAHATSTHRARVRSFTLPHDPAEPHGTETETKRHFHTTGSQYVIRLSDDSPPHRTVTTAALVHRPLPTYDQQQQAPPHVLIVGASLSGLCLAQGLKRAGIPFTVFEGDVTAASSDTYDGYHTQIDTLGYEALKAMLPDDTFELLLRCAGQAFPDVVQRDASTAKRLSGESLRQSAGANKLVFSVDRSVLRAVLLQGLDEGTEIQYKRVFKRYHVLPNKTIEVHFANGLFARGSILVGADGRESRVREQYVPARVGGLLETDCCVIYGRTPVTAGLSIANLASTSNATILTTANPMMVLRIEPLHVPSVGTAELASAPAAGGSSRGRHRGKKYDASSEDETVCWSLMARTGQFLLKSQRSVQETEAFESDEIFKIAHHAIQSWHPLARAVVETADLESCVLHPLRTAPASIPSWAPSRVTLIGDAAHAMLPSSLATTLALQDATVLCERLVHLGVGVPAVAMYEKLMRLTAHEAVLASIQTHRTLIGMPPLDRMAPVRVEKKPSRTPARPRP